jgi:hypothetical protein
MLFPLGAIAIVLLVSPAWPQTAPTTAVIGTWEGESRCTVPDSPCHDEHVVYHIAADKKNPAQLNIDADKIVNGSPQFMGTVFCLYHANEANLSCTANTDKKDDWEFHISANTMSGTLTLGPEKQLFRRINVRKTSRKTN